jgi:hypothetical protein
VTRFAELVLHDHGAWASPSTPPRLRVPDDVSGGDWIGLVALIVAVGGLVFTWLERGARREEIDLLTRQVKGEEADRLERRRADLVAVQGRSDGGAQQDTYFFRIRNIGRATARKISVCAVCVRDLLSVLKTPTGDVDASDQHPEPQTCPRKFVSDGCSARALPRGAPCGSGSRPIKRPSSSS